MIEEHEIDVVFDIYQQNCIDYNIPPKPKECIRYLINEGRVNPHVKTYVAILNEKIIAALIMIYSPATASYYLPCSIHEYRSYQPTTYLINHAINESVSRGIKYWNWESSPSKDSGVFKFKKKWGSLDGNYKIYVKLYKEVDFYRKFGQESISNLFPYFFVYPFNKL